MSVEADGKITFTQQCLHAYNWVVFPQPTRLNVFKNDQDTWDYTNPNLGGPGKPSRAHANANTHSHSRSYFLAEQSISQHP